MQDKHTNDFDLKLRSMLADAEIKPSRRVWRAVSARLDEAAASAAPVWGWMRWAGLGLAAAAVAAVFFINRGSHSIPTNFNNQQQALLAQTGETAGTPDTIGEPAAVPAGESSQEPANVRPIVRKAAEKLPADRQVVIPEVSAQGDPAEAPGPAAAAPAPASAPAAEPAGPQTVRPAAAPAQTADPFAGTESVPAGRAFRPHTALYAQGSIGSNEADFRPAPAARMAPGPASGFSELGNSTYGVPFTLGLGVRIYFMPRFSIATGLDYSLLTRTFTGSFEGISGSVAHNVQYLGIPVNLYYDILSSDKIKFYVYGGGSLEFCISNKYRLFANPDIIRSYPVNALQFSVGGGVGVEFQLAPRLGLYLDPGVSYYFPGAQPRSIRTDKPLLLNFDAGLRFNF